MSENLSFLLPKSLFFKTTFDKLSFDVLVSISDKGLIERGNFKFPEVCKADQIVEKINNFIKDKGKKLYVLSPKEVQKFAICLKDLHVPLEKPKKIPKEEYHCKKCDSSKLVFQKGRWGYYFKCSDCSTNTAFKASCGKKECSAKVNKKGESFFKACTDCNIENKIY